MNAKHLHENGGALIDLLLIVLGCLCVYGAIDPDGAEQLLRHLQQTALSIVTA
jgi:hypothetical protein